MKKPLDHHIPMDTRTRKEVTMKSTTFMKILALFIFSVLFLGVIGLEILAFKHQNLNEKNTIEHTATVTYVEIPEGTNDAIYIHIKEHHFYLYFKTEITDKTPAEYLSLIQSGDKITYRIEDYVNKDLAKKHDKYPFLSISSLTSDNEVIFTLEDHNEMIEESSAPGRILMIFVALFFLYVMFLIIRSLLEDKGIIKPKKRKPKTPPKENENPFTPLY